MINLAPFVAFGWYLSICITVFHINIFILKTLMENSEFNISFLIKLKMELLFPLPRCAPFHLNQHIFAYAHTHTHTHTPLSIIVFPQRSVKIFHFTFAQHQKDLIFIANYFHTLPLTWAITIYLTIMLAHTCTNGSERIATCNIYSA